MPVTVNQPLPVVRVGEIPSGEDAQRWLVEGLWGAQSVGVIGGAPKCAKTWLGLDMALSVATGTACLGKYAVPQPGPVLVYLAEDALPVVRRTDRGNGPASWSRSRRSRDPRDHRAGAPARSRSGPHAALGDDPAAPAPAAPARSPGATSRHRREPRRRSGRAAWRTFARCSGSSTCRSCWCITRARTPRGESPPGQGLRGSGDIHAFGDSNLYLRRTKEHLVLSSEHRAAPASAPVTLELVATDAETTHLEVIAELQDGQATQSRGASPRPSGRGRGADAGEAPRVAWRSERASGRGAGVAGASRPALPHAGWLASVSD